MRDGDNFENDIHGAMTMAMAMLTLMLLKGIMMVLLMIMVTKIMVLSMEVITRLLILMMMTTNEDASNGDGKMVMMMVIVMMMHVGRPMMYVGEHHDQPATPMHHINPLAISNRHIIPPSNPGPIPPPQTPFPPHPYHLVFVSSSVTTPSTSHPHHPR